MKKVPIKNRLHINLFYSVIILFFLSSALFAQTQSEVFLNGAAVTDIVQEDGFLWVST